MPIVQTITSYYYTAGTDPGSAWSSEAQVWDSTLAASTKNMGRMLCSTKGVSNTAKNLMSSVNNVSTVAGNPITKVEIGYRGQIKNANMVVYLQPIFGGSSVGSAIMIDPGTTVTQTLWTDITTVAGSPATWTRQNVADLDVNLYGYSSATTASASTLFIDRVLIRITESSGISNYLSYYNKFSTVTRFIKSDNFEDGVIDSTIWSISTYFGGGISISTESSGAIRVISTDGLAIVDQPVTSSVFDFYVSPSTDQLGSSVEEDQVLYIGGGSYGQIPPTNNVKFYIGKNYTSSGVTTTGSSYSLYISQYYNYTEEADTIMLGTAYPYIRVNRNASVFTIYHSTDAINWSQIKELIVFVSTSTNLRVGFYNTPMGQIIDLSSKLGNNTTIGIFPTTANMTTALPIRVGSQTGYIRMEPTSAYAGDKGTKLRVRKDDITYTICATTS